MLGVDLGPQHRRFLIVETLVSVAINALIPTAIIWRVGLAPPSTIWGATGLFLTLVKACLLCIFLMTIFLTLILRARVAGAGAPASTWSRDDTFWLKWTPRSVVLRAVVFALGAVVILVPLTTLAVALTGALPFGPVAFIGFNLAFGTLMGLLAAPFIVIAALTDPQRLKVSSSIA